MDPSTWTMFKTLAGYIVGLAIAVLVALVLSLSFVLWKLPDGDSKTQIVTIFGTSLAGGFTALIGAVGAAFSAMAVTRRNVSVAEATGPKNPDGDDA